ncbi:MAG: NAD(+)/NADH kinase [Microthrixaceae bacterium]|nr:NAD(+)/NADH kinase [Microthrixaceae bacterium]
MSAFGFVLHPGRAIELAADAVSWLRQRDHEVRLEVPDAAAVGHPDLAVAEADLAVGVDLVVSLGGDGTMLRAVGLAAPEGVAVLGVNLGQLGYLTEVEPAGMRMALKRFLAGSYSIEERMRIAATIHYSDGEVVGIDALNEVVVEKAHPGRTVRLDVELDGRPFTSYVADGLILATPTGSTAYSFSVRGPIVDPRHRAVVLTPAAAHMLFDRSLVLRPDCEVCVTVAGDREASVCVDGRTVAMLGPGDRVRCSEGSPPARLVTFGTRDFHSVLRSKFGLTTR